MTTHIVGVFACHDFDFQILEFAVSKDEVLADVTRRREVAAENHGLKTSFQPFGDVFCQRFELAIMLRTRERFELAEKFASCRFSGSLHETWPTGLARRDIEQENRRMIVNGISGHPCVHFLRPAFQRFPTSPLPPPGWT